MRNSIETRERAARGTKEAAPASATTPASVISAMLAAFFLAVALPAFAAEGPDITGVVETRATAAAVPDYGDGASASYGFEQYSNLRLKASVGERGTVYAATNLIAAAGDQALTDPFVVGANYAAALELERLYYRIEGEKFDVQTGLMRLAFGYGQAFRPTDFLSPPNPLLPDARPRGVLGGTALFYPTDGWKAMILAVAPKEATEGDGDGIVLGISSDYHTQKASVQALYAVETAAMAVHRFGLSLKVEAGASFVLDTLYTLDTSVVDSGYYYDRKWNGFQGLEASLGVDYSIFDGDLYMLCQYLYHGGGALESGDTLDRLYSTPGDWTDYAPAARLAIFRRDIPLSQLNRKNYLYAAFSYRFSDYTSSTVSCVTSLDDLSFSPLAQVEHELFQGLTLALSLRVPLDMRTFSGSGDYGELGPTQTGMRFQTTATAKLKF